MSVSARYFLLFLGLSLPEHVEGGESPIFIGADDPL